MPVSQVHLKRVSQELNGFLMSSGLGVLFAVVLNTPYLSNLACLLSCCYTKELLTPLAYTLLTPFKIQSHSFFSLFFVFLQSVACFLSCSYKP